jgi:septal ring factor EnvC (AmiA/AmiB activator)
MSISDISSIRERMEREFAAVRADLKKIEAAIETSRRELKGSQDAHARLRRAMAVLREVEWRGATKHCPSCKGAEPHHAAGCELAAVLGDATA